MSAREMFRGDTYVFDVQVQQPPPGTPSDSIPIPVDITGWFMWFTVKYNYADPDRAAVVQLNSGAGAGIVFITPIQGKAEITMPALATRGFPDVDSTVIYDVQVKDLTGRIFTVERGTILVKPDVTRSIV